MPSLFPWACLLFFTAVFLWAKAHTLSSAGAVAAATLPRLVDHMLGRQPAAPEHRVWTPAWHTGVTASVAAPAAAPAVAAPAAQHSVTQVRVPGILLAPHGVSHGFALADSLLSWWHGDAADATVATAAVAAADSSSLPPPGAASLPRFVATTDRGVGRGAMVDADESATPVVADGAAASVVDEVLRALQRGEALSASGRAAAAGATAALRHHATAVAAAAGRLQEAAGSGAAARGGSSNTAGAGGGLGARLYAWAAAPGIIVGFPHHVEAAGLVLQLYFGVMVAITLVLTYVTPAGGWGDVRAAALAGEVANVEAAFQEWKLGFAWDRKSKKSGGALPPVRASPAPGTTAATATATAATATAATDLHVRVCRKCTPPAARPAASLAHPRMARVALIETLAAERGGVPKPDRSHHCKHCGTCVLEMDHHCPWVGNVCVGAGNRKYFVLLLLHASAALTTFLIWMGPEFAQSMQSLSDLRRDFVYLFAWFLAAALWCVLTPFAVFHLWLLAHNLTTIEWCEKAEAARTAPPPPPAPPSQKEQQPVDGTASGGGVGAPLSEEVLYGGSSLNLLALDEAAQFLLPEPRFAPALRAMMYEQSPYDLGVLRNVAMVLGPSPLLWAVPVPWGIPVRPPYEVSPRGRALRALVEQRTA